MSKILQALERAEQERALRESFIGAEPVPARISGGSSRFSPLARVKKIAEFGQRSNAHLYRDQETTPPEVDAHLVSLFAPTTFEAEQYRALCCNLEQLHTNTGLAVVAVSSPTPGDGKSTSAINIAGTLAGLPGTKTLLIDMDYRRPSIGRQLGLRQGKSPGLADVLINSALALCDVTKKCGKTSLHVIAISQIVKDPQQILKAQRLGDIFEEVRRDYDYVILDMPPLVPFPDCRMIEKWVDAFLLVVAAHKTPRTLLKEALQEISPNKLAGMLFNHDDQPLSSYYAYYAYGNAESPKKRWLKSLVHKVRLPFRRSPH